MKHYSDLEYLQLSKGKRFGYRVASFFTGIPKALWNFVKKIGNILNAQYVNGDMDTRSIITIIVLNELSDEDFEKLNDYLSDNLKKAAKHARKYKGKTVKPEKEKKK